jgi:hypothetical protein
VNIARNENYSMVAGVLLFHGYLSSSKVPMLKCTAIKTKQKKSADPYKAHSVHCSDVLSSLQLAAEE